MKQAVRAIIFSGSRILVMQRSKSGVEYYTLVGGGVDEGENLEQALKREVQEETGLIITESQLVFLEKHRPPAAEQYIYLCDIESVKEVSLATGSEEDNLNRLQTNLHRPMWIEIQNFTRLPFRTPQLQRAILDSIKNGFPDKLIQL